jgi:hypothetical protein
MAQNGESPAQLTVTLGGKTITHTEPGVWGLKELFKRADIVALVYVERILVDRFQISRSAINNFVRSQSGKKARPSKRQPVAPMDRKSAGPAVTADLNPKTDAVNQSSQAMDEVFQRIAALKKRPTTASSSSMLFQYDPNEPLRIERNPGKENPGE